MITKKGRKYFKLLSIVISFVMIVTSIPLVTVFADIDQVTDSIIPDTEVAGQITDSIIPDTEVAGQITDDTVPEIGEELVLDPSLPQPADIEDGVYAIRNVGNSTSSYALFMDTQLAHWLPGYHMQQYKFTGTQTPCDTFSTSALFKISKVGGYYVIRILRNSLLSFTIHQKSDGSYEFLTTEIPLNDADVPMGNKFSIMETSLGSGQYIIQQSGTPRYVAANNTDASGAAGAPNSYLCGGTTMNGQSKWTFVKYTGAERSSVSLLGSGSLVAGEQTELYPVFYSTRPGYNQLSIDIRSPGAGYAAIDSSSPYGKIRITPYSDENMVVDIKVGNTSGSYTIDTQTWSAVLPVEEGIYFFKNVKYNNKYIQINNIDNMYEDTIIELHNFHGYYNQRWDVIHVWNGYYKIISTYSEKALEAPTGPNNDIVWQRTYEGYDTQKWKFIEQSDGTYKISPKSNLNYFMAAGNISSSADQDVEIRIAQSDDGDKWDICLVDDWSPIEEGVYFMKSEEEKTIQRESGFPCLTTAVADQSNVTLGIWNNEKITESENERDRWTFTYVGDGYFHITSYDTNKYLTVTSNQQLKLKDIEEGDSSLWKPVLVEDGVRIKLICKSRPELVLGVGPSINDNAQLRQLQYEFDDDHSDEWSLIKIQRINYGIPIGQQMTNWCWIANAKMFAQNYCDDEIILSLASACDAFGAAIGESGDEDEIVEMIQIFLNSYQEQDPDFDASQFSPTVVRGTYDEDMLINILEAGDVICVGRITTPAQNYQINREEGAVNGHFYTITGYVYINGINYFVALNSLSPLSISSDSDPNTLQVSEIDSNINYFRGSVKLFSHSKLMDGTCALANEDEDGYHWSATIICNRWV